MGDMRSNCKGTSESTSGLANGGASTRRGFLRGLVGALGVGALGATWPAASARADIYEYVDADGVAHYTNIAGKTGFRLMDFHGRTNRARAPSRLPRDTSPERRRRYDPMLAEASALYQLPVAFLRAVMRVESDFDPNVVSVDGAVGLMQLMPFTAQNMGVEDPFDPRQNILGGARFLRILANQWKGDLVLTVASYNAGAGAVQRYRGVPPYNETRRYVNRVIQHYYAYRRGDAI
jgi:soluble lytic murein transglycosylase-like protein